MKRILNYRITNNIYKNILDFLKSLGYSHHVIIHLKKTKDGILLNHVWARVTDLLTIGDILTITLIEKNTNTNIIPSPLPLHIVYEDEDLLVINKQANMPVHPSQGNYTNTLANAVAYHYQNQQQSFVYRCINRLDKDTTGLLILAKHMYSASLLSSMMMNHSIQRQYLCIATGITPSFGKIDAPISRVNSSIIQRQVDFQIGATAITTYKTISTKNGYSLVSLSLETGRTHQIRVHMQYIGHPLPGDFLYNPDYSKINRQALHSHKLTFLHPVTSVPLTFEAALPEDMSAFL